MKNVQDTLAEADRHARVDPSDKQARVWADRAIALAPNAPTTYFGDLGAAVPQIGIVNVFGEAALGGVGDDAALADYMQQAIQKFPQDERGYQLLSAAQGRLGQTPEQKATAAKLVALLNKKRQTPGATNIQNLTITLAQAYFDAGDPTNGALTYHEAIQAYPTNSDAPNGLAYAYANANSNLPEALTLAQKALALAQKSRSDAKEEIIAAIQDTLGWVQYRQGNYQEAEQNLQQAASAMPRLPEVRFHLGTVYAAEGKTDAARAEFGHAVLLSSGYAEAQQALARLPKASASS